MHGLTVAPVQSATRAGRSGRRRGGPRRVPVGVLVSALLLAGCSRAPSTPSQPLSTSAAPSGSAAAASVNPGEPWIAFQWYTGEHHDYIGVMRPDGSDRHAFTADATPWRGHVDWSHDGSQLAYAWAPDQDAPRTSIAVVNADGSDEHVVAACEAPACFSLDSPAWSPDGTRLLYVEYVSAAGHPTEYTHTRLVTLDLATKATTVLLTSPRGTAYTFPRWSPDSRSLVFTVEQYRGAGAQGLDFDNIPSGMAVSTWSIGSAASTIHALTEPSMFSSYSDWQPGGDLIVFDTYTPSVMRGEGVLNVWTVHADGTGAKNLTGATAVDDGWAEPTWTPDGRRIIMTVVAPGVGHKSLATMNADGSDQRRVVDANDSSALARQARVRPGT